MKPGRPFGLSLAIAASVLLFTIVPLLQVSMVLIVQFRLQANQPSLHLNSDAEAVEPIAVGGDFTGVTDSTLFVQILIGLAFLMIAVFAWVGRPHFIGALYSVAVAALTLLTLIVSVLPLLAQPDFRAGLDSGTAVSRSLLTTRIIFSVLVPLYVLWYANRAPARAFFRGNYRSSHAAEANAAPD